jgi:hypothetical protein
MCRWNDNKLSGSNVFTDSDVSATGFDDLFASTGDIVPTNFDSPAAGPSSWCSLDGTESAV